MFNFIQKSELTEKDKKKVFLLWNEQYPVQLNYKTMLEFDRYLEGLMEQSHILVFNEFNEIVGWYLDFIRDNERWFAIIIDSKVQNQSIGTRLIDFAKQNNSELNGWVIDIDGYKKVNGELYKSPLQFYLNNGFEIQANKRLEDEKTSAIKIRYKMG